MLLKELVIGTRFSEEEILKIVADVHDTLVEQGRLAEVRSRHENRRKFDPCKERLLKHRNGRYNKWNSRHKTHSWYEKEYHAKMRKNNKVDVKNIITDDPVYDFVYEVEHPVYVKDKGYTVV